MALPDPNPQPSEASLQEVAESQWGSVLAGTQDATWYFDFRTGHTFLNDRWFELLGAQRGELEETVQGWLDLIHPEDLPQVHADMQAHLQGRTEQFLNEHRLRTKTGAWVWVLDRGKVVERDAEGRPLVAAGTHINITERKRTEQALRASEERFKTLADLAPMGIWLSEAERGCIYVNQAWGDLTGRHPDEGLGDGWVNALHPEDRERAFASWAEASATEQGFQTECRFLRPDGEIRWGLVKVRPWCSPSEPTGGFIGVVVDITARKTSEEIQARQLKALGDLKFAIDQAAIVASTDARGVILEANAHFQRISQYSREELVGSTHRIINSGFHPAAFFKDMWTTILAGRVWHGEIRNRAKDGTHYWVDTTIIPLLGPDGAPDRFLSIRFDISERQRVEDALRSAKQEALAAVREKDQFVAFIGHEFRNALGSLIGFSDLLTLPSTGTLNERQAGYVDHLLHSGSQLLMLVNDLLDLERLEQGHLAIHPEAVAVDQALTGVLESLAPLARTRRIRLTVEGGAKGTIQVDPKRLEQVLLNLGTNAIKYNREGGLVMLRVRQTDQGWLRIECEDTGSGIPLDQQALVFRPFERLGRENTGTPGMGLGLTLSKRLVESMGGLLDFSSVPGVGSLFWAEFPEG